MRCTWCTDDADYIAYHDGEWGRPVHDDRHLFELIILEGMQAGLSWLTILKKRPAFFGARFAISSRGAWRRLMKMTWTG